MNINLDSKILLIGHGIIEHALADYFLKNGFKNVHASARMGLDATIQASVFKAFQQIRPDYVFLSSTKSGGIEANRANPGEFIYHNIASETNVIYAAWKFQVKKLLFIASSCVYPRDCPQPIREEYLLTSALESTSEPYSIAKIAGIKLCQGFRKQHGLNAICMVPATLYGAQSHEDMKTAHVLGALVDKFKTAARENQPDVVVWGSGSPTREFLHVDDFVDACLFLMKNYDDEALINVGAGEEVAIRDLARMIADATGFKGRVTFDPSKPDGAPRKLLDSSKIRGLGWSPRVALAAGLKSMKA